MLRDERNERHRQIRPTIGVLAGWEFYWVTTSISYLHLVFRGICLAAHDLGCNVLLGCGMEPLAVENYVRRPAWPVPSLESQFVPIGPWNTDGLIVVNPLMSAERSRYMQEVIASGHPVMFVGSGERGSTVVADNEGGIQEAMQHLVQHGHRRIAFIAGSTNDLEGDTGARLRAYRSALRVHGLPNLPQLSAYGQYTFEGGAAAMRRIMDTGTGFTAVLVSNDDSALGAIQALKAAGRRVPDDVAVIGFDDRPVSALCEPPLSSVHIPLFQMGYRAVEALVRRIEGNAVPVEEIRVATRLVVRESCGCGPRHAPVGVAVPPARKRYALDLAAYQSQLAQTIASSILSEAQNPDSVEVQTLCQNLVETFIASVERNDPSIFVPTLDRIRQSTCCGDDTYIWHSALSILHSEFPNLLTIWPNPAAGELAHDFLDHARVLLAADMRRQHGLYIAEQEAITNSVGSLAAQMLTALDERQVFQILARHLPGMGIRTAWVAQIEPEGADALAWSVVHAATSPDIPSLRIRSREFPPAEWLSPEQPFSLALLPLIGPSHVVGFAAFDTEQLDLCGTISQQVAAALNAAQLHREATEGRRLAEEANQLKSRFLSTVSHELRTPLNLIAGLSDILLQEDDESGAPLPDRYRKDVEQINANAQHLGQLISDVLDLASSDAGQLRLTNEFVDLGQALCMVAETGQRLAYEKGLAWQAQIPATGPWVWGDRTRLRQVALNLVSNAIKFTPRGQVSLTLEANDDTVTVAVRDTGLGVPPDEQPAVFDEFRRSERSVARGYGGLGLGLAISKRLIEMHGGTIGVHSTGEEGTGSIFFFTLPVVHPFMQSENLFLSSAAEQSVIVLTNRAGGDERLREHLDQRGFEVKIARMDDAPDWFSQLTIAPPDAVVLDMSMSPHQGWTVLKTLKNDPATQSIPVLFFAASGDSGSVMELDYVTKPVGLASLTRALDQHWLVAEAEPPAKTILLVDDDPDTLEMYARIVQTHSSSHHILKARNGREALDWLDRGPVDLVLLDLMMPEVDGFAVLERMRENTATREIPVIVVTGQALSEKDMARLNQGVAMVLGKGLFSVEETLAHVDAALERKRKLGSGAQRLVRQAMAYMHEHYAESISREDIARYVGMNEDYLTYCFRKELDMTPIAYLNRHRVNQARRLLKESEQSITEIALSVGFSDSGYFSRVFRREAGMSPESYRRM